VKGTCTAAIVLASLLFVSPAAQWLDYPTAGIPRLPNGKANMAGPTPRKANGQPDLSGIWQVPGLKYLINIAADVKDVPFQPWAEAVYKERVANFGKDDPNNRCLPSIIPEKIAVTSPWKIVETPGVAIVLYESRTIFRQIFTDGRPFPKDMNPAWQGYSVGTWDGDTFVVETKGFNDKGWLDSAGHPQTESLRLTERLRRRDFGHMDFEMTIDDPKVFTKPFTVKTERLLAPDTDLLEDVCENERDGRHFSGDNGIRLSPALLATYAGVYELAPGRDVVVTATGDLLFMRGLNEPKLPLLAQSETEFMSTATANGFEFVKDAQGKVTHLVVRGDAGNQKAVRKAP